MVTKKKATTPENESETPVKKPRSTRSKKTAETKTTEKKPRAPRKKKTSEVEEHPTDEITTEVINPSSEQPKTEELKVEEPKAEEPKVEVKTEAEEQKVEEPKAKEEEQQKHVEKPKQENSPAERPKRNSGAEEGKKTNEPKASPAIPPCPTLLIRNIVELINAPQRQLLLNDQQIQQLSIEEAEKRFRWIEGTLALVLNYDVVLSDTNIWLELLTGHTSSHSDPRFNCRLQFERQLEFISKLTSYRRGRFMIMSETYEEIDRFATAMDPQSHKDADFSDDDVCRNISGRLAKRLILSQQRENRLRIEGIGSESHHASFADPAIIRRCVELFAVGKKVLLLTNDASVGIRSMGMCDDLQRTNGIDDETWDDVYAPLRPMVMTFDDLKVLDAYTRQYHFLQMAAGKQFMEDVPQRMKKHEVEVLSLWEEGFRPGDRHSEKKQQQKQNGNSNNQQKQSNNQQKQKQSNNQPKSQQQQKQQPEQPKQQQEQAKKQEQSKPQQQPQEPKVQEQPTKAEQPKEQPKEMPKPQEQPAVAEIPQPSLISPEEASLNEEEKKQEQKQKRRGGRRGGSRKPKAQSNTQGDVPASSEQ